MTKLYEDNYRDIELRLKALPLAVELINTEVQRVLGRCNTTAIAELTAELVYILKHGALPVQEKAEAKDSEPVKKAKKAARI